MCWRKVGDGVGTGVGLGVKSGVGIDVWAALGAATTEQVFDRMSTTASVLELAIGQRGVGGVLTTGLGHCSPPATAKRKLHQNQEKLFHTGKRLQVSVEYIL